MLNKNRHLFQKTAGCLTWCIYDKQMKLNLTLYFLELKHLAVAAKTWHFPCDYKRHAAIWYSIFNGSLMVHHLLPLSYCNTKNKWEQAADIVDGRSTLSPLYLVMIWQLTMKSQFQVHCKGEQLVIRQLETSSLPVRFTTMHFEEYIRLILKVS